MPVSMLKRGVQASVIAERAPIGVQLWPTRSPGYADHFTLERVEIVDCNGVDYVRWTYRDGKTRLFQMGQHVAVLPS